MEVVCRYSALQAVAFDQTVLPYLIRTMCIRGREELKNERQVRHIHDERFTKYPRRRICRLIARGSAETQIQKAEIVNSAGLEIAEKGTGTRRRADHRVWRTNTK